LKFFSTDDFGYIQSKFGSYFFGFIDVGYVLVETVPIPVEKKVFLVASDLKNIIEEILEIFGDDQPSLNGEKIPIMENGEDDDKAQADNENGNNPPSDGVQHLFFSYSQLPAVVILAEGMERHKLGA
jgi:hypothetical protein